MSSKAANWYSSILCIIILCNSSLILIMVDCKVIKVGSDRWNDSTNYVAWALQYNFTVGDVLEFSYTPGRHNVLDVTKATFQSCNSSTGVNAKYESGDDQIVLTEAIQYWFICTIDNHCGVGMKLAINVTQPSTNTSQTGISPSAQPTTNLTQDGASPSESSSPGELVGAGFFIVAAGIINILTVLG